MFKGFKKRWKLYYYRYNLTEMVEEFYYTMFFARRRAKKLNSETGFKVYVKAMGD